MTRLVLPAYYELRAYLGHEEQIDCFPAGTPASWSTNERLSGTLLVDGCHYEPPYAFSRDSLVLADEWRCDRLPTPAWLERLNETFAEVAWRMLCVEQVREAA